VGQSETVIDRTAPSLAPDFAQLFHTMPSQYMVLDRDLIYVEANAAYCASVERKREEIVGRYVFEAFPPTGAGGRQIEESLRRVLVTGVAETLPLVAYPIPMEGGVLRMKYWSCVHTPLFDEVGRVAFVAQNAVDVTELQHLKTIAYGPDAEAPARGENELFRRAQEITALNQSLEEETRGLRNLFQQAPGFMAVITGPELTVALANNSYLQLIGHRPVVGKRLVDALPEVRDQGFVELLERVMRDREPYIGEANSIRLQRLPGAPLEERFLDFIYQPILDGDGGVAGVFVEGSDVTDRERAEETQRLLLDELNHRIKNTLATVQAIVDQTLRTTPDPDEFRAAFQARLMALSATHDLLTNTSWRSASLRDIAQHEFQPYGVERYSLEGPEVSLPPGEALALGLVFHELATNAAKYGSLSVAEGRVQLGWRVSGPLDAQTLEISWRETNGPTVAPPSRTGFGSRLIQRSLHGKATLDFAPIGLRCDMHIPLPRD
jgi:two-component sensor histidine kinase